MGFFDGYNLATSGMSAQRTRINVVSANIAKFMKKENYFM